MKVLIATGIEKLDNDLLKALLDKSIGVAGNCCHRSVIEKIIEETGANVLIISPALSGDNDMVALIRHIRERGLRVVVLPGSPSRPETKEIVKELVPLGIYDFVYDKVTINLIIDKLLTPGTLGDIPKDIREVILLEQKVSNEIEKQISEVINDESDGIEQRNGYLVKDYTGEEPELEQKSKIPPSLRFDWDNIGKMGSAVIKISTGAIDKARQKIEQKNTETIPEIQESCEVDNQGVEKRKAKNQKKELETSCVGENYPPPYYSPVTAAVVPAPKENLWDLAKQVASGVLMVIGVIILVSVFIWGTNFIVQLLGMEKNFPVLNEIVKVVTAFWKTMCVGIFG